MRINKDVGVDVDESGADELAAYIEYPGSLSGRNIRRDGSDRAFADGNVSFLMKRPGVRLL